MFHQNNNIQNTFLNDIRSAMWPNSEIKMKQNLLVFFLFLTSAKDR